MLKPEKFGWQGSESKSTQWTQIVFEGVFLNLRPFEFPTVADYSPITVKNFVTMYTAVRNHVKLIHVVTSRRGFSKGTVLCGGY